MGMGGYDTYSILVMVPASPRLMASSRSFAVSDMMGWMCGVVASTTGALTFPTHSWELVKIYVVNDREPHKIYDSYYVSTDIE